MVESAAYVVEQTDRQRPRLHGPFATKYDANAFASLLLSDDSRDSRAWVVQAEPMNDETSSSDEAVQVYREARERDAFMGLPDPVDEDDDSTPSGDSPSPDVD